MRVISRYGHGVVFAHNFIQGGSNPTVYIDDISCKKVYDGLVKKATEYDEGLDPDDVILIDNIGFGQLADEMKAAGNLVYGGGAIQDRMELDIDFASELAKINGLKVGAVDGTELITSAFYVNGQMVENSISSTIKERFFMPGDKGIVTDCMGSVSWFWKKKEPKSYRMTLKPLNAFLESVKYNGILNVSTIVGEDGIPYFNGFVPRFDYNSICNLMCLLDTDVELMFIQMANGDMPVLEPSHEFCGSLRVSMPPYPYMMPAFELNISDFRGILEKQGVTPVHIYLDDGSIKTTGNQGIVCEVTKKHRNIRKINDHIYDITDSITMPFIQYRLDIFKRIQDKINVLRKSNYF